MGPGMVAALAAKGIRIFGRRDESWDEHMANVGRTLDERPDILLDNGADLIAAALERGLAGALLAMLPGLWRPSQRGADTLLRLSLFTSLLNIAAASMG